MSQTALHFHNKMFCLECSGSTNQMNAMETHAVDLQDSVTRNSNILVLSETWLDNESDISIPNFNCIVKNKRPNTRAGGVAIHQNSSKAVNIITPSMEYSVSQSDNYGTIQSSVGDLCLAECLSPSGVWGGCPKRPMDKAATGYNRIHEPLLGSDSAKVAGTSSASRARNELNPALPLSF
ncbi:ATP-dependent DNA helicase [Trichonephila clavipes]|uniref:ATP-dependent DNA helicase n=1 Tax=Trichonephila clavipes TaxID=2585209 RepID=A0A8X6STN4_TRICX|nr:ATP-dependent DNA helicase [Trichonephila clavipes]